ncbi:23S rRNA (guanosine(2251)-2'-O)-methyltransferase RlmB [Nanchangia anserum]|uniref:23S rRNA (Guanosine(2251)-2'-O)-methyltransferase RlmB n=1 Tax=Nanchangia anserum TaxID=2692125 RepID=A0A8I0GDR5_9ACTO|nr:23S rRNA (guanosine(2251)-2'-O)-methyltransferase RlmB [Nanchangia anserum]MBD3689673.1 23S rRNA (guanosine(2251)-2'-O)-methyltransferase RlmB [Nanchangia anserum]QOX81850.1 23S rRNA (guanosine(2251)-2'-O)-methyltransferase RlmB [Nanchangia anserum]
MAVRDDHHGRPQRDSKRKGPVKGSGGKGRRALAGRGNVPKAEDRPYHAAYRAKKRRERVESTQAAQEQARSKRQTVKVRDGYELIAGRNPVVEAAASGMPIARVYLAGNLATDERLSQVIAAATAQGAPVLEVPRSDLDRATDGAVHQGVAIEVEEYHYCDLDDLFDHASRRSGRPLIVMLDGVTDPHNLGAIVRSAGAFGADGVVIPKRRSASMNVTAWKASAGAAARVPIARVPNLVAAMKTCQARGCFAIGLDAAGTTGVAASGLADGPLVLVTGAEGDGLSRLTRDTCDVLASIPITSAVESLNASVAASIALYDVARTRQVAADNT